MTTVKQIEANRLNALRSTGPRTEDGKQRSRCNAIRHGLTAETVLVGLEDIEDYEAFEATIIADYDARSAVEREFVLRLASVLWRLRRAAGIETSLFQSATKQSVQFQSKIFSPVTTDQFLGTKNEPKILADPGQDSKKQIAESFLRLNEMPTRPIARLSRYEYVLWRQARQIVITLRAMRTQSRRENHKRRTFIFDQVSRI
ncbi:MAG: hypothetical protein WCD62_13930 [Pseudolabrys sp.]